MTKPVKVDEDALQVSKTWWDRGKQLLDTGSIARSDYTQLETQVSIDYYQLVTAQATLQDYKLQLKQLLELGDGQETQIYLPMLGDENVLSPLPVRASMLQAAVALRPEIEVSKLSVEASELGIRIARSGRLPSVSPTVGIGTNHTGGGDFIFGEQVKNGWNNSTGLSISVPIFDNRQMRNVVKEAELRYQTSQPTLFDEQKTLYRAIGGLWFDANNVQQRHAATVERLRSTQTSHELTSEQFNAGTKNTVELPTERNNLLQVQQELPQSEYMAILNAQLLEFYQGDELTGLTAENKNI